MVTNKQQLDRFIEAARALAGDEDEAAFRKKLAVVASASQKPKAEPEKAITRQAAGKPKK